MMSFFWACRLDSWNAAVSLACRALSPFFFASSSSARYLASTVLAVLPFLTFRTAFQFSGGFGAPSGFDEFSFPCLRAFRMSFLASNSLRACWPSCFLDAWNAAVSLACRALSPFFFASSSSARYLASTVLAVLPFLTFRTAFQFSGGFGAPSGFDEFSFPCLRAFRMFLLGGGFCCCGGFCCPKAARTSAATVAMAEPAGLSPPPLAKKA